MTTETRRLIVNDPAHKVLLLEKATELGLECEVVVDPDKARFEGETAAHQINQGRNVLEDELNPDIVANNAASATRMGGAVLLLCYDLGDNSKWLEFSTYYSGLLRNKRN